MRRRRPSPVRGRSLRSRSEAAGGPSPRPDGAWARCAAQSARHLDVFRVLRDAAIGERDRAGRRVGLRNTDARPSGDGRLTDSPRAGPPWAHAWPGGAWITPPRTTDVTRRARSHAPAGVPREPNPMRHPPPSDRRGRRDMAHRAREHRGGRAIGGASPVGPHRWPARAWPMGVQTTDVTRRALVDPPLDPHGWPLRGLSIGHMGGRHPHRASPRRSRRWLSAGSGMPRPARWVVGRGMGHRPRVTAAASTPIEHHPPGTWTARRHLRHPAPPSRIAGRRRPRRAPQSPVKGGPWLTFCAHPAPGDGAISARPQSRSPMSWGWLLVAAVT